MSETNRRVAIITGGSQGIGAGLVDGYRDRGWAVVATFKDDGYSAFKEVTRDGFGELIAAIEGGRVDVVIVRDIDG